MTGRDVPPLWLLITIWSSAAAGVTALVYIGITVLAVTRPGMPDGWLLVMLLAVVWASAFCVLLGYDITRWSKRDRDKDGP